MEKAEKTLQAFRRRVSGGFDVQEGVVGLNGAYQQFRRLYLSGTRYTAKEWFGLMADILDDID